MPSSGKLVKVQGIGVFKKYIKNLDLVKNRISMIHFTSDIVFLMTCSSSMTRQLSLTTKGFLPHLLEQR